MEGTNKRKLSIMLVVILLMQIVLPTITGISYLQESIAADDDEKFYKASGKKVVYNNGGNVTDGVNNSEGAYFYYKYVKYQIQDDNKRCWAVGIYSEATEVTIYAEIEISADLIFNVRGIAGTNDTKNRTKLKKITLQTNQYASWFGKNCLENCSNLTSVYIKNLNKTDNKFDHIDDYAFKNCNNLKEVKFIDNEGDLDTNVSYTCSYFGQSAFEDCKKLEEVIVPSSITTIKKNCFKNCNNLTKITLPDTLEEIQMGAFEECKNLKTIYCKEKGIDDSMGEENCVTLPGSLKTLSSNLFKDCSSIQKVKIPIDVKQIYAYCFKNCAALQTIYMPTELSQIHAGAFMNCKQLNTISSINSYDNFIEVETGTFNLPSNLTKIALQAFYTTNPKKVIFNNVPEFLYDDAFANCNSVERFEIKETGNNSTYYTGESGVLYYNDSEIGETIYFYPLASSATNFKLAKTTKKISQNAFSNLKNLQTLDLTNNDQLSISEKAFENIESGNKEFTIKCKAGSTTETNVINAGGNEYLPAIQQANKIVEINDVIEKYVDSGNNLHIILSYKINGDNIARESLEWVCDEEGVNIRAETINPEHFVYITCVGKGDFDVNVKYNNTLIDSCTLEVSDNDFIGTALMITSIEKGNSTSDGQVMIFKYSTSKDDVMGKILWVCDGSSSIKDLAGEGSIVCKSPGTYTLQAYSDGKLQASKQFTLTASDFGISSGGNTSTDTPIQDTTNPVINFIKKEIDGVKEDYNTDWENTNVILVVNAADETTSTNNLQYSFDGGTTWQYKNCKEYSKTTENILIKVKDEAGNISASKVASVYIDKQKPQAQYKIVDANGVIVSLNTDTFQPKNSFEYPLTLTITATDDGGSGLDRGYVQSRFAEKAVTWMSSNQIVVEGLTDLKCDVAVYDKAGNYLYKSLETLIAPELEYNIRNDNGITFTILNKKNASGVTYCFDYDIKTQTGKFETQNTKTFETSELSALETITIAKKDAEKNIIYKTINISEIDLNTLDQEAPEFDLKASLSGKSVTNTNNKTWYEEIKLDISNATDSDSGVNNKYTYVLSYKNTNKTDAYFGILKDGQDSFTIKDSNIKSIKVIIYDNAENYAEKEITEDELTKLQTQVDTTTPTINGVTIEKGNSLEDGWTNFVKIRISAVDNESGMLTKNQNGSTKIMLYEETGLTGNGDVYSCNNDGLINLNAEGEFLEAVLVAYDAVGNVEEIPVTLDTDTDTYIKQVIKIDNTQPIINKVQTKDDSGIAVVGGEITVDAVDELSGLTENVGAYSFDNGETWQKQNTYTYDEAGTYKIQVRDKAGNIATQTIIVEADPVEPTDPTDPSDPDNPIDPTDPTEPEKLGVSTTIYKINGTYIEEIQPETTLQAIIKDIKTNEKATIEIYDKNGNKIADLKQIAGTGMKIKITLGNESKEYEIVVQGDVDGDGYANLSDMFEINKHRLGKVTLTGAKLKASDVNGDGKSDLNDMFKINKYRLGKINEI